MILAVAVVEFAWSPAASAEFSCPVATYERDPDLERYRFRKDEDRRCEGILGRLPKTEGSFGLVSATIGPIDFSSSVKRLVLTVPLVREVGKNELRVHLRSLSKAEPYRLDAPVYSGDSFEWASTIITARDLTSRDLGLVVHEIGRNTLVVPARLFEEGQAPPDDDSVRLILQAGTTDLHRVHVEAECAGAGELPEVLSTGEMLKADRHLALELPGLDGCEERRRVSYHAYDRRTNEKYSGSVTLLVD